jgi:hypothetical protein
MFDPDPAEITGTGQAQRQPPRLAVLTLVQHSKRIIMGIRFARLALTGAVLAALSGGAMAQSVGADVTASATLVRTLAVTSTSGLSFGTLSPSATAGTVVVAPDGARSATGGVTLLTANVGAAGSVNLAGTAALAYTVTMPSSVTLTASSGGQTMTLSSLTTNLSSGSGTLGSSGAGTFNIGGTLAVGANQAVASYSGIVPVTVTWN